MPALERLRGLRVVADPAALDAARWSGDHVIVLRLAPDDALAVGAAEVALDDDHAIVEDERGYVGAWCSVEEVVRHAEWSLPEARPALVQGALAGVPAKIWLPGDDGDDRESRDRAFVVATNAASATLAERLGWGRP